jgi:hypothetical protein
VFDDLEVLAPPKEQGNFKLFSSLSFVVVNCMRGH